MIPGPRTEYEQLSAAAAARVDATCDSFEQAWKAARKGGSTPQIASFVSECVEPERTVLVWELVALDRACRERFGLPVRAEDYQELGAAADPAWSSATDPGGPNGD